MNKFYSIQIVITFMMIFMTSMACADQDLFPQFRQNIELELQKKNIDVAHNSYHFVLLYNTVRTDGPAQDKIQKLLHDTLSNYIVSSDIVSLVPYELNIRPEAVFNQKTTNDFKKIAGTHIPTVPVTRTDGTEGGHDQEGAVIDSLKKIDDAKSAIIILFSDSRASQHPIAPKNYKLTYEKIDYKAALAQKMLNEVPGQLSFDYTDKGDQTQKVNIYYRMYVPTDIVSLGTVSAERKNNAIPVVGVVTPPIVKPIPWLKTVAIIIIILAGIGLIVFFVLKAISNANKTYDVQIGHEVRPIKKGDQIFIGGKDSGTNVDTVMLTGLPVGERVAFVEIDKTALKLRGWGSYNILGSLGDTGIEIGILDSTYMIQRSSNGEIVCQFNAKIISKD